MLCLSSMNKNKNKWNTKKDKMVERESKFLKI